MPATLLQRPDPVFRGLFPDWTGPRPLSFYLMEKLLEARSRSFFPTNGAGPDEDVNVYLAHLLTGLLRAGDASRIETGVDPLLFPGDRGASRRSRAERYRRNADHRLLYQGLFDRGDGLRRRDEYWHLDRESSRRRDRGAGATCYAMAANLLEGRPGAPAGLVTVLRKLADHYDDYAHVLTVLATRELGLGARLSDEELTRLVDSPVAPPTPQRTPVPGELDDLLDLVLEYRRTRDPAHRDHIASEARRRGIDPDALLGSASRE